MIKPTIGRVVWYWKNSEAKQVPGAQPLAALVTFVHNDSLVNLATFDRNGDTYPVVGVPLIQDSDEAVPSGKHCEWMPYQKGQAKAGDNSVLEKRIAALEALVAGARAAATAQTTAPPPATPK